MYSNEAFIFEKEIIEKIGQTNKRKGPLTNITSGGVGGNSSEYSRGELGSQFGKVWIFSLSLKETKPIKKEELEKYINLGWEKGRKINFNKIKIEKIKKSKCKNCGEIVCKHPEVCYKNQIIPSLIKYFGFDKSVLGTQKVYKEYSRIKEQLFKDYITDELSTVCIQRKYNCLNQRVINTLKKI